MPRWKESGVVTTAESLEARRGRVVIAPCSVHSPVLYQLARFVFAKLCRTWAQHMNTGLEARWQQPTLRQPASACTTCELALCFGLIYKPNPPQTAADEGTPVSRFGLNSNGNRPHRMKASNAIMPTQWCSSCCPFSFAMTAFVGHWSAAPALNIGGAR
jgi:hypothetical protein